MKKILIKLLYVSLFLSMLLIPAEASAQKEPGVFNTMSIGVGAGTNGAEVEIAAPLGKHFTLRASASMIPNVTLTGSASIDVENQGNSGTYYFDFAGNVARTQFGTLVNIYPSGRSRFYFVAGAFYGGPRMLRVEGHSEDLKNAMAEADMPGIAVGDQMIQIDRNGDFTSDLMVGKVRGYFGIGGGRNVPRRRVSLSFELGAQFHGTPQYSTSEGQFAPLVLAGGDMYTKVFNNLVKIYPVMKLSLHFRLF